MKRTRRVTTTAVAPEDDEQQPRPPQPSHVDATSHTPPADSTQVQPFAASSTTTSRVMETDAPAIALTSTPHAGAAAATTTTAAADSPPTTSSSIDGGDSLPITRHLPSSGDDHMSTLAAVEVQSIMHLLDRTSLLALARCSRRLHSDADADLAWKHQSTLEVKLTSTNLDIGGHIRSSLVSRCPAVSVELNCTVSLSADALIDTLHAIPRITRLRVLGFGEQGKHGRWTRMMRDEAMDGLRELVIAHPWRLWTGFVDKLVRLPHLHTLRLEGYLSRRDPLSSLPQLAHLTSLHLNDYHIDGAALSYLPVVAQCTGIIDLRIECPFLYGNRFREFFTLPNMSRLERLEQVEFSASGCDYYGWTDVSQADFAVAFQALGQLRHLCLDTIYNVNLMLFGAAHAPALLELTIRSTFYQPRSRASAEALADLLQRAPNLRVNLEGLFSHEQVQYVELRASNSRLRIE